MGGTSVSGRGVVGEELGQVDRAYPGAASPKTGLELAQATRVDRDDDVDARRLDLVELVVEDPARVAGAQDAVGAGRAAALGRRRQLDVPADGLDELSGLAVHA